MKHAPWLLGCALVLGLGGGFFAMQETKANEAAPGWRPPAPATLPKVDRAVRPDHAFGMQFVPKFDEKRKVGAWSGTRDRGMAFHRDLGVQVSREGFIWRHFEPEKPGVQPTLGDFDDVVNRLDRAGIAMQAMVTETPLWATTAPNPDPKNPASYKSAPPRGLHAPIFTDGTDTPGPGKQVNPDNTWARVVHRMVTRYQGQVRYWQMWNEPDYPKGDQKAAFGDLKRSWFGSVDDYVRLLKVGHTLVKWIDPQAQVVTGGIGYPAYLQAMLDRGAGRYFDQIDFHAYGWPGSDPALREFVRVHDAMKGVLAKNGLGGKGLICSETGYSALEPQVQADYIAKLYPTTVALGVESTMYYANFNPSWRNMGLVDWRTMSQKTDGFWAYKNAAVALEGVRRAATVDLAGAQGFRFERADGSRVYALWAPMKNAKQPQAVRVPLGPGTYQIRDAVGRSLGQATGTAALSLTASPIWLDSDRRRAYTALRPNPPLPHAGRAMKLALADSSNENHGPPDAAIDLDPNTNWVSGRHKASEAWLAVALAKREPVSRLKLKTGPVPAGTWFDVEVSQDGKTYKAVATRQTPKSWGMEVITLSQPVVASHVRLKWHNPEQKPVSFSVFELELH